MSFEYEKYFPYAQNWNRDMRKTIGVEPIHASFNDFQRMYKCKDIWKENCNDEGLQFPLTCSYPPCDKCAVNLTGTYFKFN